MDIFSSWDQVLASVIIGALTLLTKQVFKFITEKTAAVKNDQVRQGLYAAESEAERLTNAVVASLNQTVVGALKAQNGNVLSPSDAARIKSDALTNIYTLLSDESTRILIDHKTDLYTFLGHLLEEAVGNKKSQTAFIAAPLAPVEVPAVAPLLVESTN